MRGGAGQRLFQFLKQKTSARSLTLSLLALVLAVLIGVSVHDRRSSAGNLSGEGPCIEQALCDPDMFISPEQELAQRHAPILLLKRQESPCDGSGDGFVPIPVEVLLNNSEVTLRSKNDPGFVKVAPSAADLHQAEPDYYLDLPGTPRRSGCRAEMDAGRFQGDEPSVTYARIVQQEGSRELVLQYWFFYYFNDWNNKHEGDWEMIQLVFQAASARQALDEGPARIAYTQHSGGEMTTWDDRRVHREGDRPIVYVAAGSHANYFAPRVYIGRPGERAGVGCDDTTGPHRRVDPEIRLVPPGRRDAFHPMAWLSFRGRWGELAGQESDGPTGPTRKWQWREPISFEKLLRDSSIVVPARATFGLDAVRVFCEAVTVGSQQILPVVHNLQTLGAIVIAASGLGLVSSLAWTRFWPVQAFPMRGRRRLGQILAASVAIYRHHALLFLLIGLISLPAAFAFTLVDWRIGIILPFDSPLGAPEVHLAQRVALVLALSELQLGLTYAVVAAATTAVLGRMEAGERPSIGGALRVVWQRFPDLVLPRLVAVMAIGALAFTVVGIPLAIRQSIRWALIEQAVLLDGKNGLEALSESSRLVGRHWWWCAGSILTLGLLALAAAPCLGVVLLLAAKSLPLAYVNIASGLVYVCLVPYVAIALALTYFDLRSRSQQ